LNISIETSCRFQPEKQYVFQVLLTVLLEIDFTVTWSKQEIVTEDGQPVTRLNLPNGTFLTIEDHFFSKHEANDYFTVENIPKTAPTLPHPFQLDELITVIFGRPHYMFNAYGAHCGIDIFAASFFMLSRWEEYACLTRDVHGRFPGSAALAVQSRFIDRPVVNEYAELLRDFFAKLGWVLPALKRKFTIVPTHDVDTPLLWYSGIDRLRTLSGSLFKRRDYKEFRYWLSGPLWNPQDPNNTFDELMELSEKHGHIAHFNFLGQRAPDSDCYYPLRHPFVQQLIEKIVQRGHITGFHASYEAFDHPELFATELNSLKKTAILAQNKATQMHGGRQHYLRFSAPHTWQVWADHGLKWDSTLGYSDAEGFRCGICTSFPVFNFLTRKTLDLQEHPLIVMDVTLALYKKYPPENAHSAILKLKKEVQKYQGEFVILWHNSSWNTPVWENWKEVWKNALAH